jgi:Holliday junction resolvase RusA-like endonuclease
MDLDNLLKRFFDALEKTVFKSVPGRDGCVIELEAQKRRVGSDAEAGADVEIEPITDVERSWPGAER